MAINIGIIGAGKIARYRHLPETQMNPNAKVYAVCDVVKRRAKEIAKQYDCKAFTDYRELIQDADLDAVVVAATNTTHAEMTIAALTAGKHVLCEKPIATTLEDAQRMLDAAESSGKQLMVAHNQRLEPAHIKAKQILKAGTLGKVLTFSTVFGHPGCEYWAIDGKDTWFFKNEMAGLGVLGDLAIHKFDLMRYLLGENFIEATAYVDTLVKTYPDGRLIDVEDNALCLLRTEKGALGSVTVSWTYQKEDNSTIIYAEKGVMEIYKDPEFPLVVHRTHESGEYYKLAKQSTNLDQVKSGIIDAFVDALINHIDVPIPGIEGYKALEAVIACQEAAKSGQRITIG